MAYLMYILRKIVRNPARAFGSGVKYISEFRMDRRLGVSTFRREFSSSASASGDSRPCQPASYSLLAEIARHIQGHGFPLGSFVDVGCGEGRPLAYFSRLGFERMVGIEINPGIAEDARRNLAKINKAWNRAGSLEVITADILETDLDLTGSIVYLANPFGRTTMQAFARKLKSQILARPGSEILVYYVLPLADAALQEAFPGAAAQTINGDDPCHFFRLDEAAITG